MIQTHTQTISNTSWIFHCDGGCTNAPEDIQDQWLLPWPSE